MSTVTSPDGTVIDYNRYGDGPAVIFVGGASAYRAADEGTTQTARSLAAGGYTAVDYDRSGRGRSGDTQPWALDREVEDVADPTADEPSAITGQTDLSVPGAYAGPGDGIKGWISVIACHERASSDWDTCAAHFPDGASEADLT
jgi:hypothetical protein